MDRAAQAGYTNSNGRPAFDPTGSQARAPGVSLRRLSEARRFAMRWTSSRIALSLVLMVFAGAARAGTEDELKAVFAKFVAAQNAHDIKAVGELLHDSPHFLWITRGTAIWGRDAALKRFEAPYQGTWSLDPKMEELKIAELQPGVVQ